MYCGTVYIPVNKPRRGGGGGGVLRPWVELFKINWWGKMKSFVSFTGGSRGSVRGNVTRSARKLKLQNGTRFFTYKENEAYIQECLF